MHLVELAEEAAQGQRILSLQVRLGRASCVTAEALGFCFELACAGSLAEGARLELQEASGSELELISLEVE